MDKVIRFPSFSPPRAFRFYPLNKNKYVNRMRNTRDLKVHVIDRFSFNLQRKDTCAFIHSRPCFATKTFPNYPNKLIINSETIPMYSYLLTCPFLEKPTKLSFYIQRIITLQSLIIVYIFISSWQVQKVLLNKGTLKFYFTLLRHTLSSSLIISIQKIWNKMNNLIPKTIFNLS